MLTRITVSKCHLSAFAASGVLLHFVGQSFVEIRVRSLSTGGMPSSRAGDSALSSQVLYTRPLTSYVIRNGYMIDAPSTSAAPFVRERA